MTSAERRTYRAAGVFPPRGNSTGDFPTASTLFLTDVHIQPGRGATLPLSMPARPVTTAPKFGEWLKLRRGTRSLEQVAIQIRPLVKHTGLKVGSSLIHKVEGGRIPNWPLLLALGRVYNIPTAEIAGRLASAIEIDGSRDLPRHEADQPSDQTEPLRRSDVPASAEARIRELELREQELLTVIRATQDVAGILTNTLASVRESVREEAATTRGRKPGTRRGPRRTG